MDTQMPEQPDDIDLPERAAEPSPDEAAPAGLADSRGTAASREVAAADAAVAELAEADALTTAALIEGEDPGGTPGAGARAGEDADVDSAAQSAVGPGDNPDDVPAQEAPSAVAPGRLAIGVDIGGSGIKVAAVDLDTGRLVSTRHRVPTPQPSAPAAVIDAIAKLVKSVAKEVGAGPDVAVGVGYPGVIIDGVTRSAANVDPGWLEFDADTALQRVLRRPVHMINDADAAGVAEMRFGAGVGRMGTVFTITLGTGFGSGLFYNGRLIPNLELGHMEIRGRDAEKRSAAAARIKRGLSWKAWAMDLDEHLLAIEKLFSPRLFIIGGGVSKRSENFIPRLTVRAEVVPAKLLNSAGIVGAAMAADEREHDLG